VASSQTPAAGWTVLGLIAFELGPLRHDTTSVINQLENLGLRFILATESDAAVAAATARRAIFSFRK
jgi:cation transport ATPase